MTISDILVYVVLSVVVFGVACHGEIYYVVIKHIFLQLIDLIFLNIEY